MKAHLFTIWIAILVGGWSRAAEPSDFEKLQGVWRATLMEVDPEATLDRVRILFERDLATLYQAGKRVGSYRFTLDSQKPVAEIDFASPEDPTPETSKQGIYRFRGDSLELCLGPTRPTSFRGDTGADFLVFRRPAAEHIAAVPAWCLESPAPIATLDGHEGEVRQVAFSPAGNSLVTSTITGDIRLWNPQTFQLEHNLTLMLNP